MKNASQLNAGDYAGQIEDKLSSADLFFGHGTDNSWSEAQWLLSFVLSADGVESITPETKMTSTQIKSVEAILDRRISEKIPLAYLLQEAWFAGHCFFVDERVLVPRSPIAELIGNRFEPLLKNEPLAILDLCCGSGCIGLAIALAFPGSNVVLADISEPALAVAEVNIQRFSLQNRVSSKQSDLFAELSQQFDLIIANPPYVAQDEYQDLPAEYHAEPSLGLISKQDGLAIPLQILAEADKHLTQSGLLILETGYSWPALEKALPEMPFLWLEFEFGGQGVAAISADQLREHFQNKN